MEKAKPLIKILFLVGLGVITLVLKSQNYYFLILIIWLSVYWVFKISLEKSWRFILLLFLIASVLKLLVINDIAEVAFRLSLVSLIIGVSQAIFELNMRD